MSPLSSAPVGSVRFRALAVPALLPQPIGADSHRGLLNSRSPSLSERHHGPDRPCPRPRPATPPGRGGARPPKSGTTPAVRRPGPRSTATRQPRPRRRPHPHPRRGTAAGRAPDLDSPPSGRPAPEPPAAHPSRRGFSTAARGQVIDELMGHADDRHTAWDGRRGPRDRPPLPPHHLEMRPGKHTPEAGAIRRIAGAPTQPSPYLLDMPGRPVVAGSGRSRYCAPGRGSTFCLATRRSSLSLAAAARSGRRWSIPPRRWREGQVT
jgi:hypothetical protein